MKRYLDRPVRMVVLLISLVIVAGVAMLLAPAATAQSDPAGNKAAVERLMADVVVEGNIDAYEELYADDFVGHLPPSTGDWAELTKLQLLDFIVQVRRAISDATFTTDLLLAEDDLVAQRVTLSGVFASEFFDTVPTDVEFEIGFNVIYRFNDDGQIVEQWIEFDVAYLTGEVGLAMVTE